MTERLGGNLCVKRMRDDAGGFYWILFEEGLLVRPIYILSDHQLVLLAEVALLVRQGGSKETLLAQQESRK